jgi:hypothetical protein
MNTGLTYIVEEKTLAKRLEPQVKKPQYAAVKTKIFVI